MVENVRYADNLTYSFKSKDQFEIVKQDLESAYSTYSLPLKYIVSIEKYDKEVFTNKERGEDKVENLFGLKLDLVEDLLYPNLSLNIYKKQRGKAKGPSLFTEKVKLEQITRSTLSRVTAQLFDLSGCFLAPYIFSAKSFLSMACKIASLKEVNLPLYKKMSNLQMIVLHL